MIPYEQQLDRDVLWGLEQGGRHFENRSEVHHTLRRIVKHLEALAIPYAVAGDLAMFFHGFRRFTEVVTILVSRDGIQTIHRSLEGDGYRPASPGSKNLRDTESGVRIDFLISGDYPGDSRPKPLVFPDPAEVNEIIDGVRFLRLANLIELKLASGINSPSRIQELGDVQQLIQVLRLSMELVDQLHPFVREKYREYCDLFWSHPPDPE